MHITLERWFDETRNEPAAIIHVTWPDDPSGLRRDRTQRISPDWLCDGKAAREYADGLHHLDALPREME